MSSQMYDITTCPECGSLMFNGRCENRDCKYHWRPYDENDKTDNE